MMENKRVLVVGGTGFLGYHAVKLFLERGCRVTALALPPPPGPRLLPAEVEIRLADLNALSDQEVRSILEGHDTVVFAAGADDRIIPLAPAYDYFYRANVEASERFFTLARQAGAGRGVLISSYFAYFDRIWPELRLTEHHPYIRSRVIQEQRALEAAQPDLELVILELPYIFGSMPGRVPLWAPLLRYLKRSPLLFYPRGGTNMVSVEHVAEAMVGAAEKGGAGQRYVVGDENLTWAEFIRRLTGAMGLEKRVITLPDSPVKLAAAAIRFQHHRQGREGGLDPVAFVDLQTRETFFDPDPARRILGFGSGGLERAFAKTAEASFR